MRVRRRSIPSVLHNFLGTLGSRYSDFDGYWLFGLIVSDLTRSTIDLLDHAPPTSGSPSWDAFVVLARWRFADQAQINSVLRFIRRAELHVERGLAHRATPSGLRNSVARNEYQVALAVDVVSDLGRSYHQESSVFAAPHDASLETRSTRRGMEAATVLNRPFAGIIPAWRAH
jgi:hypothetical protein